MGRVPLTVERTGGGWGREPRRPRSRVRGAVRGSPGGSVHARKGWGAAVNPGGRAAHSLPGSPVERTFTNTQTRLRSWGLRRLPSEQTARALWGATGDRPHTRTGTRLSVQSAGEGSGQRRAGWDVLAGGGGPRQAATCRRGAAEGRAEKVTCDNGLREPKSSVWPQAAAVSSERLAVVPRPRASVSWVSQ